MAAEYSLGAQSLPCTTCYIATDHLGSTRMVTDQNANVVGRHDYLPFGEEIAANTGGRNGLFGTQDFVNHKFTGQERDAETGLDFFQARYFSPALGRFASPDTPLLDQDPRNPQSWNLYTYVRNNPLNLIDPDGHTCVTATGEPVAPDYPDVKVDNNDGYGCQTVVTVYGGSIDPISVILSFSRVLLLPGQDSTQLDRTSAPKTGTTTPFVPKNPDAYAPCINGLLAEAAARGIGSFFAPPSDPAWTDLASLAKEAAQNPALKVAMVYAAGKVAQRFLTKRVATRLAARVGSEFIPVVGQVAAAYMIGDAVRQGFSWYKDQVDNGACQAY